MYVEKCCRKFGKERACFEMQSTNHQVRRDQWTTRSSADVGADSANSQNEFLSLSLKRLTANGCSGLINIEGPLTRPCGSAQFTKSCASLDTRFNSQSGIDGYPVYQ